MTGIHLRRGTALVVAVSVCVAGSASSEILFDGPEFNVNTYTTSHQAEPAVAAYQDGSFVVVWHSLNQNFPSYDIFGQRFNSDGTTLGPEFQINTYTTGIQRVPLVAANASGEFVVVWRSDGQDGDSYGVFGQRFDNTGAAAGTEFQVNTYTTSQQWFPGVAMNADGSFVVVWETRAPQDGVGYGIFGRRYNSDGTPAGGEFLINTFTGYDEVDPVVATDPSGRFIVAWAAKPMPLGGMWGIFAQRFNSDGTVLGTEFQADSSPLNATGPAVATDPDGDFVVVWQNASGDGDNYGVFGQRFDSTGAAAGSEFQINTYTTTSQANASVSTSSDGGFVVAWRSALGQDGEEAGVFGQCFDSSGSPTGSEFQVNTYTTGSQGHLASLRPVGLASSGGDFVAVWRSTPISGVGQDGDGIGVFAQRMSVAQTAKVYWADSDTDKIQRADLDGSNVEDLVTGLMAPIEIDVDPVGGKIYWVDTLTGKIQRSNLDGSSVEDVVTALGFVVGVAVDNAGGKVYWSTQTGPKIQRANLDGSSIEDLVTTGLSVPHDVELDVAAGKMYWIDSGTDKIQRGDLDGSNVEDIVTGQLSMRGVALDLTAGKIYWTDLQLDKIQRADLDGSNVEDVVTSGLVAPTGIIVDAAGGKIYWGDAGNATLKKANLDGSSVESIVTTGLLSPQGVDVAVPTLSEWGIIGMSSLMLGGALYLRRRRLIAPE